MTDNDMKSLIKRKIKFTLKDLPKIYEGIVLGAGNCIFTNEQGQAEQGWKIKTEEKTLEVAPSSVTLVS